MSSSPPVFPIFNKLPPEIRCQIWRESVPDYRLVPIRYQRDTCAYVPRIGPPAVLQVNRESRREGLTIYHELRLGPVPVQDCYVDLERDIVYLRTDLESHNDHIVDVGSTMGNRGRLVSPHRGQAAAAMPALTQSSTTIEEREQNEDPLHFPETLALRHSKIVLYDLLTSPDGEALLRRFHVNCRTWSLMHHLYRHRRHRLPVHLKHLVLVYERGSGPLSEDIQLNPIHWHIAEDSSEEKPPNYDEDRIAIRMVQSFAAIKSWVNRRDQRDGLPSVLNFTVTARSLDRDEVAPTLPRWAHLAGPIWSNFGTAV